MANSLLLMPLLALLAPVLAEIDMVFTRWPETVAAPLGDEVAFECGVSVPAERLAWRRRSHDREPWMNLNQTEDTEAIHVSPPKSNATKLTISLRDRSLAGEYQCVVWYGAIVLASVPAKLSIAELKLIESSSKHVLVTVPIDNPVVLHCPEVESNPPAVYSWWRSLPGGYKKAIIAPYGVLVIAKARHEDSGTYGCTATNEISGDAKDLPGQIHLKIQREDVPLSTRFLEPPDLVGTFRASTLEARVRVGSTLRLWCGAVGTPVPQVTWTRFGDRTRLPSRAKMDPSTQSLVISSVKPEDEGGYECNAEGVRRSWRLVPLSPARWNGAASGTRATEGGGAHIRCPTALGQPPPDITWMLNADPLLPSDNINIQGEDLYIERVEKRHAGIVQCFASNELGSEYEAALLTVVPVQITGQDYPVNSGSEKSVHFSPQPRRRNRKNKGKNKVLMVPPSKPHVTRMSDESVMVSWKADSSEGLPIQFFKVQYRDLSLRSAWKTANLDIPHYIRSYEVDGLIPEHEYKFRIAAVYSNQDNKVGNSSGRFYLQRGERGLKQPLAPILTAVSPLSTRQLMVNWTWSMGNGPAAEGFYVYYRAVSDAGNYVKVTAGGGAAARHAVLAHLETDTPYDVKIQSYTAFAPSDFSVIKVARTLRNTTLDATTKRPSPGSSNSNSSGGDAPPGLYTAAGAAGGAAALLAGLALTLLLCRRRHVTKEKQPAPDECANTNGYLPGKVPITITANPLHAESGDSGMEMPYLHNNNCAAGDAASDTVTPPSLRKHTRLSPPPPMDYV